MVCHSQFMIYDKETGRDIICNAMKASWSYGKNSVIDNWNISFFIIKLTEHLRLSLWAYISVLSVIRCCCDCDIQARRQRRIGEGGFGQVRRCKTRKNSPTPYKSRSTPNSYCFVLVVGGKSSYVTERAQPPLSSPPDADPGCSFWKYPSRK